ncbi:MAG: hypothetical protein IJC48_05155 [Clostridia bacterium]|nr:hypothetical protein [Clostridia bacterium]
MDMNAKEKKLLRKQRKKEKRFARKWALISIVSCAVLCLLLTAVLMYGPDYIRSEIDFALEVRNFDRAISLSGILGGDASQDTIKRIDYIQATDALNNGDFDGARRMFLALGNFMNASEMLKETQYRQAQMYFDKAEYEKAIEAFDAITGYRDALDMISRCKYKIAELEIDAGHLNEAMEIFESIGDFEDAYQRRVQIAMDITGISDAKEALNVAQGLSAEEMERLARLNEARGSLKTGWIDVGYSHTIARTNEGNVLAAGSNQYGQMDVSEWRDIACVAAGAYHTVGLKTDGTVLACGRNDYGQTDVSGWTNVIKIAAGAFDTYALTKDGQILYTGFSGDKLHQNFTGVTDIQAGSYVFSGIHANGSMIATSSACQVSGKGKLTMADVNTGYGIAVSQDGSVYATFADLGWKDTVFVSAGGAGVMGIDADLNILSHWFRNTDSYDFSGLKCVSAAAGGGHHAVLTEDGRVIVVGDNDAGQAETGDWKLF